MSDEVHKYLPLRDVFAIVSGGSDDWGRALSLKYPGITWGIVVERDAKCIDKALRHDDAHDALALFFSDRMFGGIRYLVNHDLVKLRDVYSEAVSRGNLAMLEYVTCRGFRPSAAFLERQLGHACRHGRLGVVQYLTGTPTVLSGCRDPVVSLDRVDPAARDNDAIVHASEGGYLYVIEYLASCPGVDVSARRNDAIARASAYGRLDVVKYLVSLGADPAANGNLAIRLASAGGWRATLTYLASLPTTGVTDRDNEAIALASAGGHRDVIARLVSLGADPVTKRPADHAVNVCNKRFLGDE